MITEKMKKIYYEAFINKDKNYEGTFFVGVKSTGIFCYSTCLARKPKYENCEFFATSDKAMLSGYRPCKLCNPLSDPNTISSEMQTLIDAVEMDPEKKWSDEDFKELSIKMSSSVIRRQFKKRFGMSFVEYTRSKRLGLALKNLKKGSRIIDAQIEAGFDSDSGFRDAYKNTFGISLSKKRPVKELSSQFIDTKIGQMIAISDEDKLYLLEFIDRKNLDKEIENLKYKLNAVVIPQKAYPLDMIKDEIMRYFENPKIKFETPVAYLGTEFFNIVWEALRSLESGRVLTYSELAMLIDKPKAIRAVAKANATNQLAIIVPCHRIIRKDGGLGGYAGGIEKKKWLLNHERSF